MLKVNGTIMLWNQLHHVPLIRNPQPAFVTFVNGDFSINSQLCQNKFVCLFAHSAYRCLESSTFGTYYNLGPVESYVIAPSITIEKNGRPIDIGLLKWRKAIPIKRNCVGIRIDESFEVWKGVDIYKGQPGDWVVDEKYVSAAEFVQNYKGA